MDKLICGMGIRELIKTIIREHLDEQNIINEYDSNDSFLSNYDTAIKYAYDNIEEVGVAFDGYDEDPDSIQSSYSRDKYIELIELYVDKYNELKEEESVTIYRLVKLNSIEDLDINEIGKHWSFEREGVGAYGEKHPNIGMIKTGKPFILEGEVNPKYIDWVYGFHSFIWYGEDQWECALRKDAKVKINSINDNELVEPIVAIVGDY